MSLCTAAPRGLAAALPLAFAALLLAACAGAPKPRPDPYAGEPGSHSRGLRDGAAADVDALPPAPGCVPMREHDESLYTAGGLYAPGVADRPPPVAVDVSNLPEPTPRRDPLARWGNRPTYTVLGRTYRVLASADGFVERGIASWYGYKFHGRHTSSRERYDMCAFTAAHRTLPLPTYVRVTNLDNGRSVVVRVNDRGPFHDGRIIDLSYAAATRIDMKRAGTARVEVEALMGPDPTLTAAAPRAVSPRAAEGPQVVQAGSFGDRLNAERLVERLAKAGLPGAELDHAIVDERSVWRVRFPALAAEAARALAGRVAATGLAAPRMFGPQP